MRNIVSYRKLRLCNTSHNFVVVDKKWDGTHVKHEQGPQDFGRGLAPIGLLGIVK